jgi:REP element-mobilizing transposase RayT
MPRQVRIEFPGAFYHVMARGNRKEPIVFDDADRHTFLRTLGEASERAGFRVHAYALMTNHYHLLLETPEANLSLGMSWFQNAYTRRINTRHRLWGHLFGGRYKAILLEPGKGFWALLDYIHLNPVRAGLISRGDGFASYPWTSLRSYLSIPGIRPEFLEVAQGFQFTGCTDDPEGRRRFLELLESRIDWDRAIDAGVTFGDEARDPGSSLGNTINRGWFLGSEKFRDMLMELAETKLALCKSRRADGYHGSEITDHSERQAEALLKSGLDHFRIDITALLANRKSDDRKALIAELIQAETTVKLDWISNQLRMGTRAGVCRAIKRIRQKLAEEPDWQAARTQIKEKAIIND